ncbi:MAG: hypothetical protein HOV79_27250 [Hamadaea sp.]|nr:hypothetical protein [Hamadaea sp.]
MSGMDWQRVTAALNFAVAGRGLTVVSEPDLRGAMVVGWRAEVYLVPNADGLNVECWRKSGKEPYKIVCVGTLDEAIRVALAEV